MRGRVLTLHLRQRLTPDQRRRFRRLLQVMPEEPESAPQVIDGRVCHGEIAHPWTIDLGIRLGEFVCQQLSRQEGRLIQFKFAILCVEQSSTVIWWGLPGEIVAMPWEVEPPRRGFGLSSSPHPPILELPSSEHYPMQVPYRVNAGIMAGRAGILDVRGPGWVYDHAYMMS